MKSVRYALLPFTACIAVMAFGCSAAKDVANRNIAPINDPLQINGRTVKAAVTRAVAKPTRAQITGVGNLNITFEDKSVNRADDLTRATVVQSISKDVTASNPNGAPLPNRFTISGLILNATLTDGNGNTLRTVSARGMEAAGPFTFEKVADLGGGVVQYSLTGGIGLSGIEFGREDTQRLVNILTESNGTSNQNSVVVEFGFDADDTELPEGTEINFTFLNGEARVGI
jgi:hypothetical protein